MHGASRGKAYTRINNAHALPITDWNGPYGTAWAVTSLNALLCLSFMPHADSRSRARSRVMHYTFIGKAIGTSLSPLLDSMLL